LSTPGTVRIRSPENALAEAVAQLPKELVDASRLMQGACSARRAGAPSSFTVAGRGGVPADPDDYLASYSTAAAPDAGARAAAGERLALAMAGWDCWR
jgi:large exoprotein involved in heme utilization and adhesion